MTEIICLHLTKSVESAFN